MQWPLAQNAGHCTQRGSSAIESPGPWTAARTPFARFLVVAIEVGAAAALIIGGAGGTITQPAVASVAAAALWIESITLIILE